MTERTRRMIQRALDGATVSLEDIAKVSGVSYNSLYSWATGRRNPSATSLLRVADAIGSRSADLAGIADELRRAAKGLSAPRT